MAITSIRTTIYDRRRIGPLFLGGLGGGLDVANLNNCSSCRSATPHQIPRLR